MSRNRNKKRRALWKPQTVNADSADIQRALDDVTKGMVVAGRKIQDVYGTVVSNNTITYNPNTITYDPNAGVWRSSGAVSIAAAGIDVGFNDPVIDPLPTDDELAEALNVERGQISSKVALPRWSRQDGRPPTIAVTLYIQPDEHGNYRLLDYDGDPVRKWRKPRPIPERR